MMTPRYTFLFKKYSHKLEKFYDGTLLDQSGDSISKEDQIKTLFEKLWDLDPTRKKSRTDTIFQWYVNSPIKDEDFYKVTENITFFENHKHLFSQKDLMSYKTYQDFFSDLAPILEKTQDNQTDLFSENEKDRLYKQEMIQQSQVLEETKDYILVVPNTQEASCYWGRGTQWCTAATRSGNMFEHYNKKGPLYILVEKRNKSNPNPTKYQFHIEDNQFMDVHDQDIKQSDIQKISQLCQKYPDGKLTLRCAFFDHVGPKKFFKKEENSLKPLSPEDILKIYSDNKHATAHRYLPNHLLTEDIALFALTYDKNYFYNSENKLVEIAKKFPGKETEKILRKNYPEFYLKIYTNSPDYERNAIAILSNPYLLSKIPKKFITKNIIMGAAWSRASSDTLETIPTHFYADKDIQDLVEFWNKPLCLQKLRELWKSQNPKSTDVEQKIYSMLDQYPNLISYIYNIEKDDVKFVERILPNIDLREYETNNTNNLLSPQDLFKYQKDYLLENFDLNQKNIENLSETEKNTLANLLVYRGINKERTYRFESFSPPHDLTERMLNLFQENPCLDLTENLQILLENLFTELSKKEQLTPEDLKIFQKSLQTHNLYQTSGLSVYVNLTKFKKLIEKHAIDPSAEIHSFLNSRKSKPEKSNLGLVIDRFRNNEKTTENDQTYVTQILSETFQMMENSLNSLTPETPENLRDITEKIILKNLDKIANYAVLRRSIYPLIQNYPKTQKISLHCYLETDILPFIQTPLIEIIQSGKTLPEETTENILKILKRTDVENLQKILTCFEKNPFFEKNKEEIVNALSKNPNFTEENFKDHKIVYGMTSLFEPLPNREELIRLSERFYGNPNPEETFATITLKRFIDDIRYSYNDITQESLETIVKNIEKLYGTSENLEKSLIPLVDYTRSISIFDDSPIESLKVISEFFKKTHSNFSPQIFTSEDDLFDHILNDPKTIFLEYCTKDQKKTFYRKVQNIFKEQFEKNQNYEIPPHVFKCFSESSDPRALITLLEFTENPKDQDILLRKIALFEKSQENSTDLFELIETSQSQYFSERLTNILFETQDPDLLKALTHKNNLFKKEDLKKAYEKSSHPQKNSPLFQEYYASLAYNYGNSFETNLRETFPEISLEDRGKLCEKHLLTANEQGVSIHLLYPHTKKMQDLYLKQEIEKLLKKQYHQIFSKKDFSKFQNLPDTDFYQKTEYSENGEKSHIIKTDNHPFFTKAITTPSLFWDILTEQTYPKLALENPETIPTLPELLKLYELELLENTMKHKTSFIEDLEEESVKTVSFIGNIPMKNHPNTQEISETLKNLLQNQNSKTFTRDALLFLKKFPWNVQYKKIPVLDNDGIAKPFSKFAKEGLKFSHFTRRTFFSILSKCPDTVSCLDRLSPECTILLKHLKESSKEQAKSKDLSPER